VLLLFSFFFFFFSNYFSILYKKRITKKETCQSTILPHSSATFNLHTQSRGGKLLDHFSFHINAFK